jgi:predicted small metal-binding protein
MGRSLCGFHAFRRFRAAHLDKELVPEILVHIWMGHSNKDISQRYARTGVKIDGMFRTMTAKGVGLGFTLPELRPIAPTVFGCESPTRGPALTKNEERFGTVFEVKKEIPLYEFIQNGCCDS